MHWRILLIAAFVGTECSSLNGVDLAKSLRLPVNVNGANHCVAKSPDPTLFRNMLIVLNSFALQAFPENINAGKFCFF